MKLKLYTVKDTKVGVYYPPVAYNNTPHALRSLSEVFGNKSTQFGKYPADFEVFEVGMYDDATGHIESIDPKHVVNAIELIPVETRGAN